MAGLGIIHLGAGLGLVYAILRPSVATLILAVVMYLLGGMSITAGYHRLFAHRTYRASAPVRWFFLAFGASTFQNSALSWSADHRAHHADTDGPGDPHAITKGVWWAHMGWLFYRRECSADVSRLTDLYAVRSVRLQNRYYAVLAIGLGLALPTAIASTVGRPVGRAARGRRAAGGRAPPGHVLRELAGPPARPAPLRRVGSSAGTAS